MNISKNTKTLLKKTILVSLIMVFILGISWTGYSQQNRMGGSLVYNLHTRSLGLGMRVEIPLEKVDLLEGISIVPQFTYYPPFNPVHEFYLGSSVHLGVYGIDRWLFYTLANISYNGWINNDDTRYREGYFSNLGVEGGIGVSAKVKKCLHPFFECRYNFKWNDLSLGIGLLYTLKCDKRGAVPCSNIPLQLQF